MADLYHLVPGPELDGRCDGSHYRAPSLAQEGFVHLSTRDQVAGVAANLYADVDDLVLLRLDADRLGDIRWEDLYGHGHFPHLYGPIPLAAIIERAPYRQSR